ncbi:MAG: type II secretion system protein [Sulfuritalea sp.]|nr:type II secretion system protein [Sulfuritalea sp.]
MKPRGFTLVELLVTLVIVGILASAAIPMTELAVQRGKEQDLRQALREMRNAIDAYKQAGDDGRIAQQPTESGYPHSLDELVNGVADAKDPKGGKLYFLRKIPADPFAEATDKAGAMAWGMRSYASSREDPREGADVFDVYSRAPGAGLNDVPYREW